MALIQIKRGLQANVATLSLAQGELAVALDTGNVYVGTQNGNFHINPTGGTADIAVALQTARSFSITGDGTAAAVSFDGTGDVALDFTLANIADLTPGTYTKVTVNAKGQVTAGEDKIVVSDISDAGTAASANIGTAEGNVPAIQADGKLLASILPDLSGTYIAVGQLGVANGVATLDEGGKVPTSQLPSYVSDVVEADSLSAFPETGEANKIYVAKDTNLTYRWSGSGYVEISQSIALGETSATAYYGDKGKAAYDHSQIVTGNPHGTTAADVGAAEAAHTTVAASDSVLGHIKAGTGLSVAEDGTLTITAIDGGTF